MSRLFVNIDHVATVRNQRGTIYPCPVAAASICEMNGAEGITVHLREDRRHIKDKDVEMLRETINGVLNLEMAATDEMIGIAKKIKPEMCCIVPEKRQELTTEGGLDVAGNFERIKKLVDELQGQEIEVSLFIEPNKTHLDTAKKTGTIAVEIHTGSYANAKGTKQKEAELARVYEAVNYAESIGLKCNLGHGIDYFNIYPLLNLHTVSEYNIGHSIISRAVLVGLAEATRQMVTIIGH